MSNTCRMEAKYSTHHSLTKAPAPQKSASPSIPSSVMSVLSTSKQTASACRQTFFAENFERVIAAADGFALLIQFLQAMLVAVGALTPKEMGNICFYKKQKREKKSSSCLDVENHLLPASALLY